MIRSVEEIFIDNKDREDFITRLAALADDTSVSISELGSDIVILGSAALLLANELGLVG